MGHSLRAWVKKLEQARQTEAVEIPQADGTVMRFPESALAEAYLNHCARLGAGEDAPPEHPLLTAARNSSDPEWRDALWLDADQDLEAWTAEVPDLSEGAESREDGV